MEAGDETRSISLNGIPLSDRFGQESSVSDKRQNCLGLTKGTENPRFRTGNIASDKKQGTALEGG